MFAQRRVLRASLALLPAMALSLLTAADLAAQSARPDKLKYSDKLQYRDKLKYRDKLQYNDRLDPKHVERVRGGERLKPEHVERIRAERARQKFQRSRQRDRKNVAGSRNDARVSPATAQGAAR